MKTNKWHNFKQGSEEWHSIRAGRFGGSGISDLLTIPSVTKAVALELLEGIEIPPKAKVVRVELYGV